MGLLRGVLAISRGMQGIAGVSLVFLMLLTVVDVVMRTFGTPVPGAYELVGYAGAVAIGFALPLATWHRANVYVDVVIARLPRRGRMGFHVATRLLGIGLFLLLGWYLMRLGLDLRASGQVSPTLELKFYPVVLGMAVAAFWLVVVLLCHVAMIFRGDYA